MKKYKVTYTKMLDFKEEISIVVMVEAESEQEALEYATEAIIQLNDGDYNVAVTCQSSDKTQ